MYLSKSGLTQWKKNSLVGGWKRRTDGIQNGDLEINHDISWSYHVAFVLMEDIKKSVACGSLFVWTKGISALQYSVGSDAVDGVMLDNSSGAVLFRIHIET